MMPDWFNTWVAPILVTVWLVVGIIGIGAMLWMLAKEMRDLSGK